MFSSIDPYAPRLGVFPAIDFPRHCFQPIKRLIRTCFQITSQSAPSSFTCFMLEYTDRSRSPLTIQLLAWPERLFPLPPSTFISHFQGLPLLGVALYIGAYVLSASFLLPYIDIMYVSIYTCIKKPLKLLLINGFGDKCCWRQPFSPALKRCLGCLSLGEKQWSHPLPLAIIPPGAWHRYMPPCLCAHDTHLTVLYATRWH